MAQRRHLTDELISAYVDGELSSDDEREVTALLADRPDDRQQVAERVQDVGRGAGYRAADRHGRAREAPGAVEHRAPHRALGRLSRVGTPKKIEGGISGFGGLNPLQTSKLIATK